jgi:hypothetical protein
VDVGLHSWLLSFVVPGRQASADVNRDRPSLPAIVGIDETPIACGGFPRVVRTGQGECGAVL